MVHHCLLDLNRICFYAIYTFIIYLYLFLTVPFPFPFPLPYLLPFLYLLFLYLPVSFLHRFLCRYHYLTNSFTFSVPFPMPFPLPLPFPLIQLATIRSGQRVEGMSNGVPLPISVKDCVQLAACGKDELLPMNPELPADLFTACLTTPIKVALRW